jgi:uncharacterized protein YjbI with pentapeptide repeats
MDETSAGRCAFVFDPEEWEARTGMTSPLFQNLLDSGDVWTCPHEADADADYCLFHRAPAATDPTDVRQAFLSRIEESGRAAKQFIGARFGALDLDHDIIECGDNHQIDLRHAEFEGETNWRDAIVRQPLTFKGARFHERPNFMEARFESEVYLSKAEFEAPVRFIATEFAAGLWAQQTTFTDVEFHRAEFGGPADFSQAHFEGVQFRESAFEATVRFNQAVFEEAAFAGAQFRDRVYFDEATVPQTVSLKNGSIDDVVSFEDLHLADGSCCIDFTQTPIADGRLYLPDEGTLVYDLTDATLGTVALSEGDPRDDLFSHFRLHNTTFEGFDFGAYRETLHDANWQLHDVVDADLATEWGTPSDGDLEGTYLKAKNGANDLGDTKAAAEFFRNEMLYRREQYLPTVRDGSEGLRTRLRALGRWGANTVLNVTAGYGERPSRVIVFSVATIFVFTGLFAAFQSTPPYDTPIGYLILSLESFITLVLGGAEAVGSPWIRLLAQIEGFVGAFLIALFVFTLTRSIHR